MSESKPDYKDTIFLPKTSFSMRGNLTEKEPAMAAKWHEQGLYQSIREARATAKPFILHWGPPYANGHLHAGHALNGILKDVVARSRTLMGYNAPLVPGWDCHGLPIEWKIEEKYRKKGKKKEDVAINEFRKECREFARDWVKVQSEEFERLGIACDTKTPYITMDYASESAIAGEFLKFLESGAVYKGVRPIMWSPIEKTALADAETEYQDKTSPAIYVSFPIKNDNGLKLDSAKFVIWTTTPWTIPGNRAIAYGPDIQYVVLDVKATSEDSQVEIGSQYVLAHELHESLAKALGITDFTILKSFVGTDLDGMICHHPLRSFGYDFDIPLIEGHHVTTETGTGLVHTAPGHGPDDFELGKKLGLEIADTITDNGVYADFVKGFAGTHVYKADPLVMEALAEQGNLVHKGSIKHSYPHSWRSKAPLIFRTTPQWFIKMDGEDGDKSLRQKALTAIEETTWIPKQGENRIRGMVEDRPDWCLSRQRTWGVPITLYTHKDTGEVLSDKAVNQRILSIFAEEGCDVWFDDDHSRFLAPNYNPDDYQPCRDILDVWFESGSTQGFVLENRDDLQRPADLYLEGSDQHRGWFQSSLLVGCGTRGDAPYKTVVTHGFTVDAKGHKMSKSAGNTISPIDIANDMGVEILRLWVVSCDYTDDLRIGKDILKHQQDIYRRYRNTLRYLLGALDGSKPTDMSSISDLPDLERWVLHKLDELYKDFLQSTETVDYQGFYSRLHHFCSVDLSAFYFDIRKDSLYCDGHADTRREATLAVMHQVFHYLIKFLAPVVPFTAEEAWKAYDDSHGSIHLELLEAPHETWHNPDLDHQVTKVRDMRSIMTAELELARKDNLIGSSLQARVIAYDPERLIDSLGLSTGDLEDLLIVSQVEIKSETHPEGKPGLSAQIFKATDEKCDRCWKVLPEVGTSSNHPTLCGRCETVVASLLLGAGVHESLEQSSHDANDLSHVTTNSSIDGA